MTARTDIKERKKEATTEEALFLLNSRFFKQDKKLTEDPETFVDAWKKMRPDLDILQQLRKAEAFLLSTSKTYRNHAKFITNWLNRERTNNSSPNEKSREQHLAEIEADARKHGVQV